MGRKASEDLAKNNAISRASNGPARHGRLGQPEIDDRLRLLFKVMVNEVRLHNEGDALLCNLLFDSVFC